MYNLQQHNSLLQVSPETNLKLKCFNHRAGELHLNLNCLKNCIFSIRKIDNNARKNSNLRITLSGKPKTWI